MTWNRRLWREGVKYLTWIEQRVFLCWLTWHYSSKSICVHNNFLAIKVLCGRGTGGEGRGTLSIVVWCLNERFEPACNERQRERERERERKRGRDRGRGRVCNILILWNIKNVHFYKYNGRLPVSKSLSKLEWKAFLKVRVNHDEFLLIPLAERDRNLRPFFSLFWPLDFRDTCEFGE